MSKLRFDNMLKHIIRELDYLFIIAIENDVCPLDVPKEAMEFTVRCALSAFNMTPTPKAIEDGIDYYFADQIVNIVGGTK